MKQRTYAFGDSTLTLVFGDITKSTTDVIVSSDDYLLSMGGGVSAAILRAGGEGILIDAAKRIPANVGDVIVTTAGSLQSAYVFHAITIGPDVKAPVEASRRVVEKAIRRSFKLMEALGVDSVAFPAIGAGRARFAYEDVAVQMSEVIAGAFGATNRRMRALVYLYDRFGHMSSVDFVRFFEEFAKRASGFTTVPEGFRVEVETEIESSKLTAVTSRAGPTERRQILVGSLSELNRRRNQLEARLVRLEGGLNASEVRRINDELTSIHRRRLEVLGQVNEPRVTGVSAFVSYAREDEVLRRELGKHLRALERQGLVQFWHDRQIKPGSNWKEVLDSRLDSARLILFLLSADFLDSSYCYEIELQKALEMHSSRRAVVVPVILRPVLWKASPLSSIQALPRNGRAVTEWESRDAAFVDVAEGVREVLDSL